MIKIKVIDLLVKIANGEKPIIKEGINTYKYNEIENDYITGMGYNYEHYFSSIDNILNYLNDEVEIIEEDNKIEKLNNEIFEAKDKEIERLKEEKESWKRVATKNFNEAEDCKSIIKEVKEYINTVGIEILEDIEKNKIVTIKETLMGEQLLEILDKGDEIVSTL